MSLEVFVGNCAKFVLYTTNLIGLVTPQFYHPLRRITVNVVNASNRRPQKSTTIPTITIIGSSNNSELLPDALTAAPAPPNNRQLLCQGFICWCNFIIRSVAGRYLHAKIFICLIVYPLALCFVKSVSSRSSPSPNSSYFNLFVFITLYFHYILMFLVITVVVLRNRSGFTAVLLDLYSLIQASCDSIEKRESVDWTCREKGSELSTNISSRTWIRSRSIELGFKCGILGPVFVALCWLSINLPILTLDNWITMLLPSLILILPMVTLLLLTAVFCSLSVIMESLFLTLNDRLRMQCLRRIHRHVQSNPPECGLHQQRSSKLWQLSICDNMDDIIQYYTRTLQLLKQLNGLLDVAVLLIVLNCFFNIAVQAFSIYMTVSTTKGTADTNTMQNDTSSSAASGFEWDGIGEIDARRTSKDSSQKVPDFYILAVNSVYILINYCELYAVIRASTRPRAAVSI